MADSLEATIASGSFIPADLRIVAIGKTGVGKSSTCNTLLGEQAFKASAGASSVTEVCTQATSERCGRTIQVVDTPGFFDTQVVREISSKITECVTLSSPGPHAILLVIRVGRFTEEDTETVREVKKWFGDEMVNFMIIVFTGQDELEAEGLPAGDFIDQSPDGLKQLLVQANHRYLTVNNRAKNGDKDVFVQSLLEMVEEMRASNGGGRYTTTMYRAAEQRVRDREASERRQKEQELQTQRDEIERDLRTKYDGIIGGQTEQIQRLKNEMSSIQYLGNSGGVDCSDKVRELQQKLDQVEQQKTQMDQERSMWESNLQAQASGSEMERSQALAAFKLQLDDAINRKEAEIENFSARIEQERLDREQEMTRRGEEKRQREEEEHQRRLQAIAEEERMERERHAREQAEREAAHQLELAAIEASHRRHRWHRRHRHHRDDCSIC